MNLERFDYFLFDMDGTLVNTELIGSKMLDRCFEERGTRIKKSDLNLFEDIWFNRINRYNQNGWICQLANNYEIEFERREFLRGFYQMVAKAEQLPGANRLLNKLNINHKMGLVTASRKIQVDRVLSNNNWNNIFDVLVSKELTLEHKPNPAPYLLAMEKLGADPEKTVVFEDTRSGVESGKAAGCFVIGVKIGNTDQDLSAADLVIDDLTELEF